MNLEEIYMSFNVEEIAERSFQEEVKRYEAMQEGPLKEMRKTRLSKDRTLAFVKSAVNGSLVSNPNTPAEVLEELFETEEFREKGRLASNPNTPADILYKLYDMGHFHSLVKNPNAPTELLQQIYDNTINNPEDVRGQYNPNTHIFYDIAQNPNAPQEVLRALSVSKDGISGSETIQSAVAKNPSTPPDLLEDFAQLDKGKGIYIVGRSHVLQNPNIPVELMDKIVGMSEEKTTGYASSLVKNPNISPQMLRDIEENLNMGRTGAQFVLSDLLKNPNTPLDIIEKYADRIDYGWVMPGDLYSTLYSIVKNPNTPSQILKNIKTEIDQRREDANCSYVISDLLENPNVPHEIFAEYIQEAIDEGHFTNKLMAILENPTVFDDLREKEVTKTPLQQREDELTGLEAEKKRISEAEALMDKQTGKDGQDIGEE